MTIPPVLLLLFLHDIFPSFSFPSLFVFRLFGRSGFPRLPHAVYGFRCKKESGKTHKRATEKREQQKEGERLSILFWLLIYRFRIIIVPILTVLICLYSFGIGEVNDKIGDFLFVLDYSVEQIWERVPVRDICYIVQGTVSCCIVQSVLDSGRWCESSRSSRKRSFQNLEDEGTSAAPDIF